MKTILKKILKLSLTPLAIAGWLRFKSLDNNPRFTVKLSDAYPCIKDKTIKTGFDRHYVYHTSWAARKVRETAPELHMDISSSLFFAGIVSAFAPVKFYDYRPADITLPNLESLHADILSLPFADNSVKSLSCMHVVEHIGLGRYGDPIDPEADLKAARELGRVLAINGNLFFVVPIGHEAKIQFNAHRIYTYEMAVGMFPDLVVKEFALISERSGGILYDREAVEKLTNEDYACGCFWFVKK